MNTIFIGIAGGTGSGKTTLTEHLAARFGSDISVVHHDNYYKRQDRPFAERCLQNYDHPDAFDTDLMIEDLKALKRGETIHCPVYDYAIHNRTDETVEIKPTKVVIVEGILIFQNKALRDLLDIKIFVETDADVRILRRVAHMAGLLPPLAAAKMASRAGGLRDRRVYDGHSGNAGQNGHGRRGPARRRTGLHRGGAGLPGLPGRPPQPDAAGPHQRGL